MPSGQRLAAGLCSEVEGLHIAPYKLYINLRGRTKKSVTNPLEINAREISYLGQSSEFVCLVNGAEGGT
jgi:hypothetical protein